jgi:hypothetical protein
MHSFVKLVCMQEWFTSVSLRRLFVYWRSQSDSDHRLPSTLVFNALILNTICLILIACILMRSDISIETEVVFTAQELCFESTARRFWLCHGHSLPKTRENWSWLLLDCLQRVQYSCWTWLLKGRIHKETKQLVAIKILNLDTAEGGFPGVQGADIPRWSRRYTNGDLSPNAAETSRCSECHSLLRESPLRL